MKSYAQAQKVTCTKQSSNTRTADQAVSGDKFVRRRTSSLDSEKENQPVDEQKDVVSQKAMQKVVPSDNLSGDQQPVKIVDLQDPSIVANGQPVKSLSGSEIQAERDDVSSVINQDMEDSLTEKLLASDEEVDEEEVKLVNVSI